MSYMFCCNWLQKHYKKRNFNLRKPKLNNNLKRNLEYIYIFLEDKMMNQYKKQEVFHQIQILKQHLMKSLKMCLLNKDFKKSNYFIIEKCNSEDKMVIESIVNPKERAKEVERAAAKIKIVIKPDAGEWR